MPFDWEVALTQGARAFADPWQYAAAVKELDKKAEMQQKMLLDQRMVDTSKEIFLNRFAPFLLEQRKRNEDFAFRRDILDPYLLRLEETKRQQEWPWKEKEKKLETGERIREHTQTATFDRFLDKAFPSPSQNAYIKMMLSQAGYYDYLRTSGVTKDETARAREERYTRTEDRLSELSAQGRSLYDTIERMAIERDKNIEVDLMYATDAEKDQAKMANLLWANQQYERVFAEDQIRRNFQKATPITPEFIDKAREWYLGLAKQNPETGELDLTQSIIWLNSMRKVAAPGYWNKFEQAWTERQKQLEATQAQQMGYSPGRTTQSPWETGRQTAPSYGEGKTLKEVVEEQKRKTETEPGG